MKHSVLFLLLLILAIDGYSQMVDREKQIDSLRTIVNRSAGVNRVDALNLLSEYTSQSPHATGWVNRADSQKHYASIALTESENIKYSKGKATALVHLGSAYWLYSIPLVQAKKDFTETMKTGVKYSSQGLSLAESLQLYDLIGTAYLDLSSFEYRLQQDQFIKLDYMKKSADAYRKAGNNAKEQEVCTWLCDESISSGRFEEGFDYCRRSSELAQKNLNLATTKEDLDYRGYLVQQSLLNLSSLYSMAGDYNTARNYLFQSKNFSAEHKTTWNMDVELATLYREMGKLDSAVYYQDKSAATYPDNIWNRMSRAETLIALKEFDKAYTILEKDYDSYWEGKSTYRVLLPVAKSYAGKKEYSEALRLMNLSLTKVSSDARTAFMKHYEALADVHHQLGNNDSAYYYQVRYQKIKDSILTRQFLWQLNNYKKAAIDAKRSADMALLERNNLLKDQRLAQEMLFRQKQEAAMALLNRDNEIKGQQLTIQDQKLKEQILLQEQKQSKLTVLDKENRLKDEQLRQESFIRNALLAGLFLLLALTVFVIRSLNLKRKNERLHNEKVKAELQQQSSELEMQALRAQMNPHFIFNCLSSINKFILKNESRSASDYLTRFSRLIRTVLTNSQLSKIPLYDELEMLRLYLEMERLRFNDNFDYEIIFENTISPDLIYIPPMILQPICENAIWHGLMHKEGHGKLEIRLKEQNGILQCSITDNGVGRKKAAELKSRGSDQQKSFGLKITTERLALFNNGNGNYYKVEDLTDANNEPAGTRVTIRISHRHTEKIDLKEVAC